MGAIKITPADAAFSKCVRARAGWACERCGAYHGPGSRGLGCSHHHGRGAWAIRLDPLNAEALCTACHFLVGGTEERRKEVLTEYEQALLFERKADIGLAKMYRKTKGVGPIAKYYREQFKEIEAGQVGFKAFFD